MQHISDKEFIYTVINSGYTAKLRDVLEFVPYNIDEQTVYEDPSNVDVIKWHYDCDKKKLEDLNPIFIYDYVADWNFISIYGQPDLDEDECRDIAEIIGLVNKTGMFGIIIFKYSAACPLSDMKEIDYCTFNDVTETNIYLKDGKPFAIIYDVNATD